MRSIIFKKYTYMAGIMSYKKQKQLLFFCMLTTVNVIICMDDRMKIETLVAQTKNFEWGKQFYFPALSEKKHNRAQENQYVIDCIYKKCQTQFKVYALDILNKQKEHHHLLNRRLIAHIAKDHIYSFGVGIGSYKCYFCEHLFKYNTNQPPYDSIYKHYINEHADKSSDELTDYCKELFDLINAKYTKKILEYAKECMKRIENWNLLK